MISVGHSLAFIFVEALLLLRVLHLKLKMAYQGWDSFQATKIFVTANKFRMQMFDVEHRGEGLSGLELAKNLPLVSLGIQYAIELLYYDID